MNKLTALLALSLLASSALAAPDPRVARMAENCKAVMDEGVCRIALDPKDYPLTKRLADGRVVATTIPVITSVGRRDIPTRDYLGIRATGFKKNKQGGWAMCSKVLTDCGVNAERWDSNKCVAVRTMGWRY